MATIPDLKDTELQQQYESLDRRVLVRDEAAIDAECLLAFRYEYPEQDTQVEVDTDEFTAVCPWTGLPDNNAVIEPRNRRGPRSLPFKPGD